MTAPAHDPQIRECCAQRTWRVRVEPEYEPAARRECSVNPLQRSVDDFPGNKGTGKPCQRERFLVVKVLYPLGTELYAFGYAALGEVLVPESQRRLP
jgi:hypothetical protein